MIIKDLTFIGHQEAARQSYVLSQWLTLFVPILNKTFQRRLESNDDHERVI